MKTLLVLVVGLLLVSGAHATTYVAGAGEPCPPLCPNGQKPAQDKPAPKKAKPSVVKPTIVVPKVSRTISANVVPVKPKVKPVAPKPVEETGITFDGQVFLHTNAECRAYLNNNPNIDIDAACKELP